MASNVLLLSFLLYLSFFILSFNFLEAQLVPALFIFGDSLVDVGNNNYLTGSLAKSDFPPNGVDLPDKKPTGRFSNGKNVADFLSDKMGLPTSPPYLSLVSKRHKNNASFLTGVNLASAGAGIFNNTGVLLFREVLSLTKQVDYFLTVYEDLKQQLGSSGARKLLSKSLFAVVTGSNDVFAAPPSFDLSKRIAAQRYVDSVLRTLKEQLQRIYNCGARKFVIPGVGMIGCCPFERAYGNTTGVCNGDVNYRSLIYNEALKSMLQKWKSEVKDIGYSYTDSYSILQNLVRNGKSYGFVEIKSACCGLGNYHGKAACVPVVAYCSNRSEHLFWDPFHPVEAAQRMIVDFIFDGPPKYAFPLNVRQLIAV